LLDKEKTLLGRLGNKRPNITIKRIIKTGFREIDHDKINIKKI
jgi:hypothetical protein